MSAAEGVPDLLAALRRSIDAAKAAHTPGRGEKAGLAALSAAATPGPWEVSVHDSGLSYRALNASIITAELGDRVADVNYDGDADGPHGAEGADARFIAALVNAYREGRVVEVQP